MLVGCLMFQQHARVSQGWICSDNCMCCHTETEAADQTLYFSQSPYTDTGPTSPSTDTIMPDAWHGCHWREFLSGLYDSTWKKFPKKKVGTQNGHLNHYANEVVVVCWLLDVPATCECISGADLLRQFYVLPHWDRSCRLNFPSHPVTVYWHRANQSPHCWPYNARRMAG